MTALDHSASLASWESWLARLLLSGRGWHYGLSPSNRSAIEHKAQNDGLGCPPRVSGGASCGRDPARASWVLQTFHALGQDRHWVEQAHMTGWERAQAVGIVMLATLAGIGALVVGGFASVNPVRAWLNQLPGSFEAAGHKLAPARESLEQVSQATHALGERSGAPPAAPAPPTVPPFLVQFFGTTATLVAGLTEVLLLLYLLLASGDLFLRKLVEVLPMFRDKRTAVEVTEQVQQAVTQYIVTTLVINVGQGVVVGFALWGLGMHSPWLWGGLTVILEFIPYLGATGMIILLTAAAFSQFDPIGHILLVPGTYLVIAALQNNLVSPLVYGQRLKLNPVAVLAGVLFWWLLWGVAGAFLAVPFFATLKILADHVESLTPIATFLGE